MKAFINKIDEAIGEANETQSWTLTPAIKPLAECFRE